MREMNEAEGLCRDSRNLSFPRRHALIARAPAHLGTCAHAQTSVLDFRGRASPKRGTGTPAARRVVSVGHRQMERKVSL